MRTVVLPRRRRSASTLALVSALAALGLAGPAPALAATDSVTLVGSLQSELGCPTDWDPACTATFLTGAGTTWSKSFDVPAGTYEYKVALNGGWTENYGAGGKADGANIPLVLAGPATVTVTFDETSKAISLTPVLAPASATADKRLAGTSLREPVTREQFYFVMADRFANGSTANDSGGLTGTRLATGFDPTDKGFYHGGDLKGLTSKLDYIKGLGTTAIWLTPSFKNRPVQGTGENVSAGYHGYWITDFTQIDPHLGTNADMKALISAAHGKGMKVFFDIITNHTADVIDYREKTYTYVSTATDPYTDAAGNVFDPKDVADSPDFPALDPATSFPYTPFYPTPADATVKVPAWLNDITLYHNRGDSTFAGESSEYGDFIGLDDLFTENPKVVDGFIDVYNAWVDLGIDGFRIDTVKHVNTEFWQRFSPAVMNHAKSVGTKDFFMFGEIFDGNPAYVSTFPTTGKLPAALDFPFQGNAVAFAKGKETTGMASLFAADDYYIDADSNAYQSPTFLGNHDMGRVAMMLQGSSADDTELMSRVDLANELMFLSRGNPVVYYGDEQGFIGLGGDKDAREDMFATKTQQYAEEKVLGGPSGSRERFDPSHPIYRSIATLGALRKAHPALADGAQLPRYAAEGAGVLAFSRVDSRKDKPREYVVALNNATTAATATFTTGTSNATLQPLYGTKASVRTGKDGSLTVSVPPLSAVVYASAQPMDVAKAAPTVLLTTPAAPEGAPAGAAGTVGGRAPIAATVTGNGLNQVTFAYRPVGTTRWTTLGTDDNAPYRVFHDVTGIAKGTLLEYRVVARDTSGRVSGSSAVAVVGDAPTPGGGGGGPAGDVVQPASVSVPGTLNSEMGCAADWSPDCAQARLTLDPAAQVWKGTFTLPAGGYGYKVAINGSWDENYGANAVRDGANIDLTVGATPVTFYYDHRSHWVTSDAQGPIITAPGSYQSELGCAGDWQPDCMRPWLQDPDGDGTFTWITNKIPAGTYEFKVAHGLGWTENYGEGGVPNGPNISLVVPDGATVSFSYDLATHVVTATTG